MNIKPLHIETVFSGFIHLVWITLLTFLILEKPPTVILNSLSDIGSGTAVFLIAVVFSASFFLGRITEHFIIAVNYFFRKSKRQAYAESFDGSKGEIWGNKLFSFSSFIGLLFLGIALFSFVKGEEEKKAIIIIGGMLCFGTVCSFIYWVCFGQKIKPVQSTRSEKHWLGRLKTK